MKNKSIREMNTDEIKNHILELQKNFVEREKFFLDTDSIPKQLLLAHILKSWLRTLTLIAELLRLLLT